jgi:putative NADH-flavin reductase
MKITLFGATGAVGRECLDQCLEAGHEMTVLARTPSKLPESVRSRVTVVEGDGLDGDAVARALEGSDAALFAIGIDGRSPEDLCTDVTRHILDAMPRLGVQRLVWCGGGSTRVPDDTVTLGGRFVELFARTFMGLRHRDKAHQLELLESHTDIEWIGVRPLQIRKGPKRGAYRVGFDAYSGMSQISFADCAHAMIAMLDDDTWLHKAPIVQY